MDWLKTSFAAPDFPVLTPQGIPDKYTGRTLPKMFRKVTGITIPSDDFYVIVPPVPGFSHIEHDAVANPLIASSILTLRAYSDHSSLFGPSSQTVADQVTAFRYMSQLAELVPTTNATSWSGHISTYKVPLKSSTLAHRTTVVTGPLITDLTRINPNYIAINGGEGITATSTDQYTAPSNLGMFAAATSDNNDFIFTDITEGSDVWNSADNTVGIQLPGTHFKYLGRDENGSLAAGLTGWGELDTIVIRVQGAAGNTFILKTWAAIEFQVLASSALYQYSRLSPSHDPAALAAYRSFVIHSPVAVSYYENANFWTTLLNAATTVTGMGTMLPGGWGAASGALNVLLGLIPRPKGRGRGARTAPPIASIMPVPNPRGGATILPYPMQGLRKSRARRPRNSRR